MKAGVGAIFCLLLAACALFGVGEASQVEGITGQLMKCQAEARAAADGGHLAAYEACKKDAGL